MQWLVVALVLFASSSARAEVVYLKQSELFAYAIGQQAGAAVDSVRNVRQYSTQRAAEYDALDRMRRDLAACGSCASRDKLAADIKTLQSKLLEQDRFMCGTWNALADTDPAIGAIKKLTGYATMCDQFYREASYLEAERDHAANKKKLAADLAAGSRTAYSDMANRTYHVFSHLSHQDRKSLTCPYWFAGAKRNEPPAVAHLADSCLAAGSPADRTEAFEKLKSCANAGPEDRQRFHCFEPLSRFYVSTRPADRFWPNPPDDREALRLLEAQLEDVLQKSPQQRNQHAHRVMAQSINDIRARLAMAPIQVEASTPSKPDLQRRPPVTFEGAPHAPPPRPTRAEQTAAEVRERRCQRLAQSRDRAQQRAENDDRHATRAAAARRQFEIECS